MSSCVGWLGGAEVDRTSGVQNLAVSALSKAVTPRVDEPGRRTGFYQTSSHGICCLLHVMLPNSPAVPDRWAEGHGSGFTTPEHFPTFLLCRLSRMTGRKEFTGTVHAGAVVVY
jgi:hypothetical protein